MQTVARVDEPKSVPDTYRRALSFCFGMRRRAIGWVGLVALTLATFGQVAFASQQPDDASVVIRNVTVVSPERRRPLTGATVVITGGRIRWVGRGKVPRNIPSNLPVIDATGKFLVPGFIDAHVHVSHPYGFSDDHYESHPEMVKAYFDQMPLSYLYFGFTSLVDLDLSESARTRYTASQIAPTLYSSGRGIRFFKGYGPAFMPESIRYRVFPVWVYDENQVDSLPKETDLSAHTPEAAVEASVKSGALCVKTYHEPGFGGVFNWPVPSPGLLRRIAEAAHARRLPVFLHATSLESYKAGIDAGVDVFAHGMWHWPGSRLDPNPPPEVVKTVRELARRKIAVQPTARVLYGEQDTYTADLLGEPRLADVVPPTLLTWLATDEGRWAQRDTQALYKRVNPDPGVPVERYFDATAERVRRMLSLYRKSGVRLLFGSDTPASDGTGNPPGLNGYLEIRAWAEAGIPPGEILRALTLDNARALGLEKEIGTVEVGKRADLLVLGQDPSRTVDAYDSILVVFVNGKQIARNTLSAGR